MNPDAQLKAAVEKGFDSKLLYNPYLECVNEPVRTILEKHSNIPADKILQHVKEVRDRAFAVFPYACIGQFSFLELSIASSPYYHEMLERVKGGEKLLDLGCAFGQELRQLMFDGAPAENLYGCDLQQSFLDLGYELFLDHSKLPKSQLIRADILDKKSNVAMKLAEQISILYISLFIHVFEWNQQVTVAKNMLDLLIPKAGSLIVCRVVAARKQETLNATQSRMPYYYHSVDSWNRLWEQVRNETEIKLSVETWEQADDLAKKHPLPGIYILGSAIRRL